MSNPELALQLTSQQQSSSIPIKIKGEAGFYSLPAELIAHEETGDRRYGALCPSAPAAAQQTIGMLVYDRQSGCLVLYPTAPRPLDDEKTTQALSRREQDVLQLLPTGLSNRQIGRILAISESTVKSHVGSIFSKLNVSSRAEAAVYALRMGMAVPS